MQRKQKEGIYLFLESLLRETAATSWELIKIMVPVIIVVKLLEESGGISFLSVILEPFMALIGLPGELGLVWATAMLTSLYGGLAVFAAIAPGIDITVAQVTILCSAMLIAHSLPVELSISKRTGTPLLPILVLRCGGALLYCLLLHILCGTFAIWQQSAVLLFAAPVQEPTLVFWVFQQFENIGLIIFVIFIILLFMRLLKAVGGIALLEKVLAPVLPWFGMTRQAASLTVVGMLMGLGYGGALIIRETATGKMSRVEVYNSMILMALCHGLVEDTLIMVAMGASLGGILWGRIVFALVVTAVIAQIMKGMLCDVRVRRS